MILAKVSLGSRSGLFGSPGTGATFTCDPAVSKAGKMTMRRIRRDSRSVECLLCRLPEPKLQPASKKKSNGMNFDMGNDPEIPEWAVPLKTGSAPSRRLICGSEADIDS